MFLGESFAFLMSVLLLNNNSSHFGVYQFQLCVQPARSVEDRYTWTDDSTLIVFLISLTVISEKLNIISA